MNRSCYCKGCPRSRWEQRGRRQSLRLSSDSSCLCLHNISTHLLCPPHLHQTCWKANQRLPSIRGQNAVPKNTSALLVYRGRNSFTVFLQRSLERKSQAGGLSFYGDSKWQKCHQKELCCGEWPGLPSVMRPSEALSTVLAAEYQSWHQSNRPTREILPFAIHPWQAKEVTH